MVWFLWGPNAMLALLKCLVINLSLSPCHKVPLIQEAQQFRVESALWDNLALGLSKEPYCDIERRFVVIEVCDKS